jgi:hypothetical protein
MRPSPGIERAVALAFVEGKGFVELVEATLRQLDCLERALGTPDPSSISTRLPISVCGPSLAAQHVARFLPASTSPASSSANSGLSPNENCSSDRQSPSSILVTVNRPSPFLHMAIMIQ